MFPPPGIGGSFLFPLLRKWIGVRLTGMVGFYTLIATLVPSIVSVWLPGSPFDPLYLLSTSQNVDNVSPNSTSIVNPEDDTCHTSAFTSVGVFLSSIIAARTGLWISDLSVTQIMQVG